MCAKWYIIRTSQYWYFKSVFFFSETPLATLSAHSWSSTAPGLFHHMLGSSLIASKLMGRMSSLVMSPISLKLTLRHWWLPAVAVWHARTLKEKMSATYIALDKVFDSRTPTTTYNITCYHRTLPTCSVFSEQRIITWLADARTMRRQRGWDMQYNSWRGNTAAAVSCESYIYKTQL